MVRSNARISHTFLPYTNGKPFIWISGGSANLKPETANTWSIGADIKPSFVPRLTLSATYYNIDFKNMIGVNINGLFGEFAYLDPANASYFILNQ